jgi:hypothetical protein
MQNNMASQTFKWTYTALASKAEYKHFIFAEVLSTDVTVRSYTLPYART